MSIYVLDSAPNQGFSKEFLQRRIIELLEKSVSLGDYPSTCLLAHVYVYGTCEIIDIKRAVKMHQELGCLGCGFPSMMLPEPITGGNFGWSG